MSEKRVFERVGVSGNANIKQESASQSDIKGFLSDISFGGFSIFAPQGFNADEPVAFELSTPTMSGTLQGVGKIRHIEAPPETKPVNLVRVGVEFAEVNKDLVQHLINRVHQELSSNKSRRHVDFMPF